MVRPRRVPEPDATAQRAAAGLTRGCRGTAVAAEIPWLGVFKRQQDVNLESEITAVGSEAKPPSCLSARAPRCSLPDARAALRKTPRLATSRRGPEPCHSGVHEEAEGAGGRELVRECQPRRAAPPRSWLSAPASVKGTPSHLVTPSPPPRTGREMPRPLSTHPGNAHHQAGSPAASGLHPGVLPGVATMGGAWPLRI